MEIVLAECVEGSQGGVVLVVRCRKGGSGAQDRVAIGRGQPPQLNCAPAAGRRFGILCRYCVPSEMPLLRDLRSI